MTSGTKSQGTLVVGISPEKVDAGSRLTLIGTANHLPADLDLPVVVVIDADGAERARASLHRAHDAGFTTGEIIIAAPRAVGQYAWRAVVKGLDAAGAPCEAAVADVLFDVVPHTLDLVVWDVSPVVVAGRRLKFRADIKCSGECAMGGQTLSITDGQGQLLAKTEFTDERWPETDPIYAAEIELAAPKATGQYAWTITATADSHHLAHATASQQMMVTVVPPPDCVATVEVRDRHTHAPLAGARVTLAPYHGWTNAEGVATLPVAKGSYQMQVTRRGYAPHESRLNVRTDIFTTTAMEAEPLAASDQR